MSLGNKIAGDDECNCEEFRGRKMSGMGGFEFKGCGGGWGCSGTIGCCSWRKWRWAIIQFLAGSRMLRMVFARRFQEFMGPL